MNGRQTGNASPEGANLSSTASRPGSPGCSWSPSISWWRSRCWPFRP